MVPETVRLNPGKPRIDIDERVGKTVCMKSQEIQLTDHYEKFVEDRIRSGRYGDAGEVFRAGLRLLEAQERERELKTSCLRKAAEVGFGQLDRGEGISVPLGQLDAFLDECLEEAGCRPTR